MRKRTSGIRTLSPYGFIVLTVLFERTLSSFSQSPQSYLLLATVSAISWLVLTFLEKPWFRHPRVFFAITCVFVSVAFLLQETLLVGIFPGPLRGQPENWMMAAGICLSVGYTLYVRFWLTVFERKKSASALICIAVSSGLSAIYACLPPLLLGNGPTSSIIAFFTRVMLLVLTFVSLKIELGRKPEYDLEPSITSSTHDVLSAIKVIFVAALVARFTQGVVNLPDAYYRAYGAQLLLIASPLISICIVLIAKRYGRLPNFASSFYWSLAMFGIVMLLVPAAVLNSNQPIEALWVLQFASFAQLDIAFLGVMASIRQSFGPRYYKFTCIAFSLKDLVYIVGTATGAALIQPYGNILCVCMLIGFIVFAIMVFLVQVLHDSNSCNTSLSILDSLISSISESYELTVRERDVVKLLLQGRSYASIAQKLFISTSTVKTHVNHIFTKMDVGSRDELIDMLNPFGDNSKN